MHTSTLCHYTVRHYYLSSINTVATCAFVTIAATLSSSDVAAFLCWLHHFIGAMFPIIDLLFALRVCPFACSWFVYLGREISLLRELNRHPCVVSLRDIQYATTDVLYMVFEYMDQVKDCRILYASVWFQCWGMSTGDSTKHWTCRTQSLHSWRNGSLQLIRKWNGRCHVCLMGRPRIRQYRSNQGLFA